MCMNPMSRIFLSSFSDAHSLISIHSVDTPFLLRSRHNLLGGLETIIMFRCTKWRRQSHSLHCTITPWFPLGIGVRNELFPACIDKQTHEVRAHVVAAKVGEGFGEVRFIEVDLEKKERLGKIG